MDRISKRELAFPTLTEAIERSIHTYLTLRESTLQELYPYFNRGEINTLLSIQRGKQLPIDYQGSIENYLTFIEDSYRSDSQPFINKRSLIAKLRKLSSAQIYFLREELNRFWNSGKNLDDYLDRWTR